MFLYPEMPAISHPQYYSQTRAVSHLGVMLRAGNASHFPPSALLPDKSCLSPGDSAQDISG